MTDEKKILYATIAQWEHAERLRRDDTTFDGWHFIAAAIGHKSDSTLRKMCQAKSFANGAKLGRNDAIIIMSITHDYRLLHAEIELLRELQPSHNDVSQLRLFSEPIHSINL